METVKEVISYLEAELAEAVEQYEESKDKQQALCNVIKVSVIEQILDAVKR